MNAVPSSWRARVIAACTAFALAPAALLAGCSSSGASSGSSSQTSVSHTTSAPGGESSTSAPAETNAGASSSSPGASSEATDCDGYPTQDIELVVPFSPGGGFDTRARLIAPVLQKYLPNKVNVNVNNITGAGGIAGTTEVYGDTPDGSRIVEMEPGALAAAEVTGQVDTKFEEMLTIGQLTFGPEAVVVSSKSPYKTIQDLQKASQSKPLLLATSGLGADAVVSFDALGIKYTNINDKGSSESMLSIIRGDTDFTIFPLETVAENVRSGDLRPLLLVGDAPGSENPNADLVQGIPTIDEITGTEGLGNGLTQHYTMEVAPKTPACIVQILSDALGKVFQDKDFLDQLHKAGYVEAWKNASDTQEIWDNVFKVNAQYKDLLTKALLG